jgi:hypothetical protein
LDGMLGDAVQNVGEPGLRIDVVHLAGFDQGIDSSGATATSFRSSEGPISSPDSHTA